MAFSVALSPLRLEITTGPAGIPAAEAMEVDLATAIAAAEDRTNSLLFMVTILSFRSVYSARVPHENPETGDYRARGTFRGFACSSGIGKASRMNRGRGEPVECPVSRS